MKTKNNWGEENCSVYRGLRYIRFVTSRFFFVHFTISGVKKIVPYTEVFVTTRFFFVHFTISGVKKIVRYTEDFVVC